MEPPPTQTIARFPSNVFSASKAPFPWYKSLGNVNLAIVQNPFLVLLLMDSSGRSDQQNFCFPTLCLSRLLSFVFDFVIIITNFSGISNTKMIFPDVNYICLIYSRAARDACFSRYIALFLQLSTSR